MRQLGQQAGEPLRQHRLAGAGRPDHEQAQLARGRDFEGTLGRGLTLDIAQVRQRGCGAARHGLRLEQAAGIGGIAGQERAHDIEQMPCATHLQTADERGFLGAGHRQHQHARAAVRGGATQRQADRQGAMHRPQLAAERELAGELEAFEARRVDLSGCGQDAEGDRQVEATRFLRQVRRCEADGDALVVRELEAARLQGGAHALARLLHLGVGEAHQGEARQAVGEMDLDLDLGCLEAAQGPAVNGGEAHAGQGLRRVAPAKGRVIVIAPTRAAAVAIPLQEGTSTVQLRDLRVP